MDSQSAVDCLLRVERSLPPSGLQYKGKDVWPTLRRALWFRLIKNTTVPREMYRIGYDSGENSNIFRKLFDEFSELIRGRNDYKRAVHQSSKRLGSIPPGAILGMCYPNPDLVSTNEGSYDTRLDPYLDFFAAQDLETAKLLVRPKMPSQEFSGWVKPPIEIDWTRLDRTHYASVRLKNLLPWRNPFTKEVDRLADIAPEILEIPYDWILEHRAYEPFFREILSTVKPKLILLTFFYNPHCMGLIAAARSLSIPVVDLQHGKQGIQGMYYGWSKVPSAGYHFLPDWFWMWGDASAENIQKEMPADSPHKPIVGGNLWLGAYLRNRERFRSREIGEIAARCQKFRKVILVSLQHDSTIADIVLDAMSQKESERIWLIRCHPVVNIRGREEIVADITKRAPHANFDVEDSSNLPLYDLLDITSHHITAWSSVVYEAQTFGIPTTFVHPEALIHFGESIERGEFDYASNSAELESSLEGDHCDDRAFSGPDSPFIQTSEESARLAVGAILGERTEELL